jgi:hypothetical protein
MVWTYRTETLICSRAISWTDNEKRHKKTELHMAGIHEERFEELEYHERVSIRFERVKVSQAKVGTSTQNGFQLFRPSVVW